MNKPVFVLVHGAWHDARCWALLVPLLQAAGHRVLTPDLPGHGHSTLPWGRATLKGYIECVKAIVAACPEPVILLGHSMAGLVITAVAASMPAKIHQLVYLCAYLPHSGDSVFALIARNRGHEPLCPIELALTMSDDKRSCSIETDSIIPLFYSATPPALAQQAQQQFGSQGSLPLAAELEFDEAVLGSLQCCYIVCSKDKVIPQHHQRRMLAAFPGFHCLELAADHSPFFSMPAELASQLLTLAAH